MTTQQALEYILLGIISFALLVLTLIQNFSVVSEQHFIYLASSFLEGHFYFNESLVSFNALDYSLYEGKYYWPQAPFAAVVLMPFVAIFGKDFLQGYVQVLLLVGIVYLIYNIARSFAYSKNNSLYFSFLILFSSVLYGLAVIPWSFYFAQILAFTLVLFSYYLYRLQKPLWIIGFFIGLAIATRYTVIIAPLFFMLHMYIQTGLTMKTFIKIVAFSAPMILIGMLLLFYNYVRFDSLFETGYAFASLGGNDLYNFDKNNLFSFSHIPRNLYYYFFTLPELVLSDTGRLAFPYIKGSSISLSFFIVAPFFMHCARSIFIRSKDIYILWVVIALQLVLLLSYYSPGTAQYLGPRYMLDTLPWLFIVLLIVFQGKDLLVRHKLLIAGSGLFNLYLIFTVII